MGRILDEAESPSGFFLPRRAHWLRSVAFLMRCDNILFTSLQLFFLEERRRQCLQDLATLIQKIYRGWKCRSHFLLLKSSQIVVAAWYRRYAVSPSTGMNVVQLFKEKPLANYHLIAKRQLLSPLLAFLNCRFCHLSNKRNTRRSSAPPPWCSPTPEAGR